MSASGRPLAPEAILPVKLGSGGVDYAQGMRAGRWLFLTGLLAQDFKTGIARGITEPDVGSSRTDAAHSETSVIFDHLDRILAAGGTSRENIVRVDQFFTTIGAIAPYQGERRKRLGAAAPASTSVITEALPLANASMQIDAIAVIETPDFKPRAVPKPDVVSISGPSPCVTVGDFVFISGQLATADPGVPTRGGMPEEACVPDTVFWGGQPIQIETEYVLRRRITPALERAGSSARNVVKAQVYLTHAEDLPVFRQVWAGYFGGVLPATTIVVMPKGSFGIAAARVEINLIALRDDAAAHRETIECDAVPACAEFPVAVKAGDLLFLSGLVANDRGGAAAEIAALAGRPLYGSPVETEAQIILDKAERICVAAGTSLSHVVRAQQFQTDLSGFNATCNQWRRKLGARPLPLAAIGIPGPMPIPGCSLLMDLCVYAPGL